METVQQDTKRRSAIIDFAGIWAAIKRRRNVYYKVVPITIFSVWIITLGIPNYYSCKIVLAPELGSTSTSSALASIASSFGINLGGTRESGDAITVFHYPDLLSSTDFKMSLFSIKVQRKTDKAPMTYYDYLLNEQKKPWWVTARDSLMSLVFGSPKKDPRNDTINTFEPTPQQLAVSGMINQKIICTVGASIEKQSSFVMIEVKDQDPYVAATLADSVKERLQTFITEYKTQKARHDLAFTENLYKESKRNYEHARQLYADFMDANQDIVLENVRQKQTDLENNLQLLYNHYNAISSQLLSARVRVQESTPAFTTLQSASVPVVRTGPNRSRLIAVFTIAAIFFTTLWVLFKENQFKSLLGLS